MWDRRSRHSSCGEETSRFEAGRFTTRSSVPDPHDAPVCAERCDELVARSPSRTARGFVAGRSAARVRLGQSDGGRRDPPHRYHESAAFISCQHDHVVNPVTHQCGFVGCRVGEASNPGPVLTRRGRRAQACHDTHIDVSSDEEPLVRPNMGRDVIARTEASGACNAESHIRSTRADSTVASDATPGRDVLLKDRQTLETTQPATPVALRTAGVITEDR